MKINAIEPTPSPNTMKIILDEELPMGKSNNYKKDTSENAPSIIKTILNINGVKGVYHVADFLAVERNAKFDWKEILPQVRQAFGETPSQTLEKGTRQNDHYGEINVLVQLYKGIPMQVKLTNGDEEKRFGLPEIFTETVKKVQRPEDNVVVMRRWKEYGVRYGDINQVGHELVEELQAAYPKDRLTSIVEAEQNQSQQDKKVHLNRLKLSLRDLEHPDWRNRYCLLEQMEDPDLTDLPVLEIALGDEKVSIRRLATVYLGMIKNPQVLPLLYRALRDKTVTVRRTAGDCLSDLGFVEATSEMVKALTDDSKLVRWRAAMFLYEVGDDRSLPALKQAQNDPEFEVSLQIKLAIERIEGGKEAKGSVWKQMTDARNPDGQ
ncbi:conserved virulence factor C family protein [Bacillus sp. 1NLA3E]|uniref:conserved virulence factor C family protein n=1 Tax=Bacillus sp. 1NLA3E TaxID=666686 RepID=UPI000247F3BA|nr:conserved virulence factor C family protein [Bacillus sp. 1NLA3E]AGK54617.1 hypothetical protein B1NLA3E_14355 [Bacillus sp. 1NLA3E]